MDPMSAAASIIGLLGAAAKISEVLLKFIGNIKGAPKLAQNVLMEVSDVSACLNQLQRYLQGALTTSASQEQLLMVEQLVVTLSNCVLIFSELEETVDSLKPAEPMRPWRLAQWLFKEQAISALMVRMQQSKLTLSLMLTTLTCTSIGQAQSSASQLTALIQQVLESNLEMSQRMANLEMRTLGYTQSAAPILTDMDTCRDDESINTMKIANDPKERTDGEQSETSEEPDSNAGKESTGIQMPTFSFTFDHDLNNSRPYARAMKRNSVWSTASSANHTMGWSYLSGLSLADVSEISIIGLPQELWNGGHYILTDIAKKCDSEETLIPVMDGLAHGRDKSLVKDDWNLYNIARPMGDSAGLGLSDRQATKDPVAAGGRVPEPKKTMFLGASMSGKTTIHRHLQIECGYGFTDSEREKARESVIHLLVEIFKKARRQYQTPVLIENIEHFETLAYATRDQMLNGIWSLRCYRALIALWSNPDIRSTIEDGRDAALHETVPYLLENLDFLFNEIITPDELLLRGYYNTTSIHKARLDTKGRSCEIIDVGGRRSQRKKWLSYFQDVDTVIFVVSLTGYCQALPENINVNQMQESLMLFESVTKLDGFQTVPIILLLNKFDLLEERMRKNPIMDHYPEYSDDSDPLAACRFFAAKYSELDRRPHGSLRILVTSAVEPETFKSTIDELWPDLFDNGLTVIPEAPE